MANSHHVHFGSQRRGMGSARGSSNMIVGREAGPRVPMRKNPMSIVDHRETCMFQCGLFTDPQRKTITTSQTTQDLLAWFRRTELSVIDSGVQLPEQLAQREAEANEIKEAQKNAATALGWPRAAKRRAGRFSEAAHWAIENTCSTAA